MMEQVPTSTLSAERCHLGEGATYDVATDTAWWFDILEGRLFEAQLGSGQARSHQLGRMASALARIDAERQLIAAEAGSGGCVDVYSPRGEHLRCLRVPARQASCPAFVGPDLSRLLVTSAWQDMDEAARAADPEHGHTFLMEVAARGRPEPDVKLAN
jgi:sugar lactone lactonase YvrE